MHYVEVLSKDKKLKQLLIAQPVFNLKKKEDIYLQLCGSVISQQLSVKAAAAIFSRFLNLFENARPTVQQISETPPEVLRSAGLSVAKAAYILNISAFARDQGLDFSLLKKMDDEQVIAYITQIKGIGRWTTEMLLMFALQREDVFPVDDLGIQMAMKELYHLNHYSDKKELKKQMLKIAAKWIPYRTYACMHLWAWRDKEFETRHD